jgi:ribonucleoside-triphosphate reductase (thioredoxin)
LNDRVKAATFIGTLQAGYTDFHYLRDVWRETTEEDALIGVSMTGIASGSVLALDLSEAAKVVVDENKRVADIIGINVAARTSLTKPEGSASCVVGSSSGIHAWHNDYYIRRMRIGKNEAIYGYLKEKIPSLIEDCVFKPHIESVVSFPQKAPESAILRTESAADLLNRVLRFNREWIAPGHNRGVQHHNVSCTISVKDTEWGDTGEFMWEHRNDYNGIAVLPYDGGTYVQAPFEDCTKDVYEQMIELVKDLDLSEVVEYDDMTSHVAEPSCAGGACEVI